MDARSTSSTPAATGGSRLGSAALVLGSAVSVQFGAAVAALVFPRAGALGTVTLRLALSALVLLAVCRPRLRGLPPADWALAGAFGVALAAMNTLFYQAIERIPLGAAATLEVLGPLALSVLVSRRAASALWAALALAGVFLLGGSDFERLDLAGTGFALAAGAMWAAYILLSARTGRRFPKTDGLAVALGVGALLSLPLGVVSAGTALLDPATLALGAAVAVLSSLVPYTLELHALRGLPPATFGVLMGLEPAIAAAAGYLVLRQALSATDGLAMLLVIAASMGAMRTPPKPPADAAHARHTAPHGTQRGHAVPQVSRPVGPSWRAWRAVRRRAVSGKSPGRPVASR
jgi:inner membrane transporter RhtA